MEGIDQYEHEVLPNGEAQWKHPRETVKSMTCLPVGDTDLHKMECVLGRCDDCPSLSVPLLERDVSNAARMIDRTEGTATHMSIDGQGLARTVFIRQNWPLPSHSILTCFH